MKYGIAFGGNIGNVIVNFHKARIALFKKCSNNINLLKFKCAPIYKTKPVDCEENAPDFFNSIIEIHLSISPLSLLKILQEIESYFGRKKSIIENLNRKIDLDIIYAGNTVINDKKNGLVIPHPRYHERLFVLTPLAKIRKNLILPNESKSIYVLEKKLLLKSKIKPKYIQKW